jgi:hypothetical protein
MMRKLYKTTKGRKQYWEAWNVGRKLVVHFGTLGTVGKKKTVRIRKGVSIASAIAKEAAAPRRDGFEPIALDDHATLIVQYKTKGWGSSEDHDKRVKVEDLLNECLGWTGNGHCDGGDIGSGTINAFSFVVDPHLATKTVVAALRQKNWLEGAMIAFHRGDDPKVLWPPRFKGVWSA